MYDMTSGSSFFRVTTVSAGGSSANALQLYSKHTLSCARVCLCDESVMIATITSHTQGHLGLLFAKSLGGKAE